MIVVVDTSALLAVVLGEPNREALIGATTGVELVAPASVHWEVGNALSALLKRKRVSVAQAQSALAAYGSIPIRFIDVDLSVSIELAATHALYAYDAYLLACALTQRAPLLTLDVALQRAARDAGIEIAGVAR